MGVLPVILFFLYTFGLGFTLCRFVKEPDNFLEKNLVRIGVGLSALPVAGTIFSLLHIPVDWKIFLFLSAAYPIYHSIKNYNNFKFSLNLKFKRSDMHLFLVIIVFILVFYMHYKGSFAYPYLEDDDSWSHALGVKYVAVQKTFFNPSGGIHYLDPYPPAYDGLIGLMSQASSSLFWTLKFFNALIISLSIVFFYLFVKEFTDNSTAALFSTMTLAMVPAYMSHFIWAHAFIPGFIFLSFLFLERIKYDRRWMFMASIAIASIILTTITQSMKFAFLFFIYFALKSFIERKFISEIFIAGAVGFLISLIWWIPLLFRYKNILNLLKALGLAPDVLAIPFDFLSEPRFYLISIFLIALIIALIYFLKIKLSSSKKNFTGAAFAIAMLLCYAAAYSLVDGVGTADRIYDFNDFFVAHKQNMINNPVGIGIAAFSLLFLSIFFIMHDQYSALIQKKAAMPKMQHHTLFFLWILSSATLFLSSASFFFFRFKPGTFLKQYMLSDPSNYNYVHSFSFIAFGIYFFIASLILAAAVYAYMIYKEHISKQKSWVPISLLWFVYAFAGLYYIPTQFFPFRTWTLLAAVLSIITGYGFVSLLRSAKKSGIPGTVIWLALIILIFATSGIQKYAVNTAVWPPGGFWTSNEEIKGYIWLKDNVPAGTKVFTFSNNAIVIGFDKFVCHWCKEVNDYQRTGFSQTSQQNYNWLKKERYNYMIIDGQAARIYGPNETNNKINELLNSGLFRQVYATGGFVLLQTA